MYNLLAQIGFKGLHFAFKSRCMYGIAESVTEDGKGINAYRVALSASSYFFQQVFKRNQIPQTIMYIDNVSHQVLEGFVHFMYAGQVKIEKDDLKSFLKMGDKFKIDGLLSEDENEASNIETITELTEPEVNISGEEDFILKDTSLVDNAGKFN